MSWIHRAWPLALLALASHPACTTDDSEDETAAESGSNNDTANATADATADGSSADGSVELGCAADIPFDTTDGAMNPLMETWGAPCTTNEECVALIGDPLAICDQMAVVYELPGGYCTKACSLPDMDTRVVLDAADCSPDGGVACIGAKPTFERCGLLCTDDNQCNRAGYECRQMPLISNPEDPSMCLMPDCCLEGCVKN
jgi:hypothetical protein